MLVEKNYPLRPGVLTMLTHVKLEANEEFEMADMLVIKIFNLAQEVKSRSKRFA